MSLPSAIKVIKRAYSKPLDKIVISDDDFVFETATLTSLTVENLTVSVAAIIASLTATSITTSDFFLLEPGGPSTIEFLAPSLAASYTLTFPATDGDPDQFLQTDGAGNLSWVTVSTSVPDPLEIEELRILEPGGPSYSSFVSPALAGNVTYTLPADDGLANQVLTTDGAGILTWTTPSTSPTFSTVVLVENDGAGNNTVTVHAAASFAANFDLYLPPNDGDADGIMVTDGAGVLTFTNTPKVNNLTFKENDGAGGNTTIIHAATSQSVNYDLYLPPTEGGKLKVLKVADGGLLDWDYRDDNIDAYTLCGTTLERWKLLPMPALAVAPTTAALVADTLYATPFFVSGAALNLDKLTFEVTTVGAAGTKARIGIYNNTARFAPYPDQLMVDAGEFAVDAGGGTGYKTTTGLDVDLPPSMYWAVIQASAAVTIRVFSAANVYLTLGVPTTSFTTNNYGHGWQIADAYGALPSTFPGNVGTATLRTVVTNAFIPLISGHYTGEV